MSTAPAGWHRQPDGRDRYWDGQRWTDEFRDPSDAATQQIPLDETRGMPAADRGAYASQAPGPGGPGGYAPPPSSYGQPYTQGGPLSDGSRGSGWLKGCLIALLVLLVLAVIAVVAGIAIFRSASDRVSETVPTIFPTELPTDLPTGLPTDLPTALPTDLPTSLPTDLPTLPGQGESATAGLGEEFTLAGATIQPGWTVEEVTLGFASVTMSAIPGEASSVPLIFEIVFFEGDTDVTRTTCSVPLEPVGETVDVACVPVRGFTDAVDRIQATGVGG